LLLGVAAGAAIYFGLIRLSGRHLFAVTSLLILFLTAGMAAQGAKFLVQAGYLPALGGSVWDSSFLIPDGSVLGNVFRVLLGYTARPEGIQVLFYGATIVIIGGLMLVLHSKPKTAGQPVVLLGVIVVLASSWSHSAQAEDLKVYSPIVEQNEYALEVRGNVTFDNNPAHKGAVNQITELEVTPTSFWHTALLSEITKEPPGNLRYEVTGWENIFQLTPQGAYLADLGAYVEYDRGWHQAGDSLEWKLLAAKDVGRFTVTVNPIFETSVSGDESGETEFRYAAQMRWRYRPQLEPAVEVYGTLGTLSHFDRFKDQSHQIGPVMLGVFNVGPLGNLRYEAGYLFGVTRPGSPQGAFKLLLEWERYF
jgi:hypothetical protein